MMICQEYDYWCFLSVCSELFHSDEVNPKVVLSWWFTVFWLSINNPVLGNYGGFFTPNNICLAILFVINHIMYMSGQFLADVLDGQLVHVCTQGTQIVFHTVCDQLANKASMFCFTVYLQTSRIFFIRRYFWQCFLTLIFLIMLLFISPSQRCFASFWCFSVILFIHPQLEMMYILVQLV